MVYVKIKKNKKKKIKKKIKKSRLLESKVQVLCDSHGLY